MRNVVAVCIYIYIYTDCLDGMYGRIRDDSLMLYQYLLTEGCNQRYCGTGIFSKCYLIPMLDKRSLHKIGSLLDHMPSFPLLATTATTLRHPTKTTHTVFANSMYLPDSI